MPDITEVTADLHAAVQALRTLAASHSRLLAAAEQDGPAAVMAVAEQLSAAAPAHTEPDIDDRHMMAVAALLHWAAATAGPSRESMAARAQALSTATENTN